MNVFKFLSATLPAGTCLFSGCKKEKSIVPENPSVAYSGGYPFSISGDIRSVPS